MERLVHSVLSTAAYPPEIEFITMIDKDDHSYDDWRPPYQVKLYRFKRRKLSILYNLAYARAVGPVYMLGSDDVIFHTEGWDNKVKMAFEHWPDRIAVVHGDDGDPNQEKEIGTLPFVHRNWIKATGRFLPPYFTGDFTDTWLSDLANGIGRRLKIDIHTEHMHPAFGKALDDPTYAEKWEKHFAQDMPQKYLDTLPEREADIEKLKDYIALHEAKK